MRMEIERRPALTLCAGLILGLTLARHPLNALALLPAMLAIRTLGGRTLLAASFALGAVLGPGAPPARLIENRFVEGEWAVVGLPKTTPYGQRMEVEHDGLRLRLTYAGPLPLCPGAMIHVAGIAEPPPEGMDAFYEGRGLSGNLDADPDSVTPVKDGPWIQRIGRAWRDRFVALASANLPAETAATASALCFNADGLLDSEMRDEMQRTGTTHIIAASGLQVLIIGQALGLLLLWLPVPRILQLGLAGLVLALYAVSTGLNPPIVRAVLMWLIANAAYLFRSEPDWPSALAVSSLLYLIWKPATVYEMGFQFSVVSVLFLSMFGSHIRWRPGPIAWASRSSRQAIRTAAVAFVTMTPLVAYHFGLVSIVSVPANLLIFVAVAPVVVLSMVAIPASAMMPAAGSLLFVIAQPLFGYIEAVLRTLGGDGSAIQVPPFSAYWLVPFYAALAMLWRPHVRPA